MTASSQPALPHAEYERFESARQFETMMDELIPSTQRVIRIFEKSLATHFNSPNRCSLLRQFLRAEPSNRLYVVVHEADAIERTCPRFITLLQHFSHSAKVRQTPRGARHIYDPFVIFDASHYLHKFHYAHMRYARGLNEIDGVQQLLDRFSELWEVSTPAAASGVLGL